jgi:hypothetical protein
VTALVVILSPPETLGQNGENTMSNAATCPVCDYKLDANARTVRVDGKEVRVCCDECADKLQTKKK